MKVRKELWLYRREPYYFSVTLRFFEKFVLQNSLPPTSENLVKLHVEERCEKCCASHYTIPYLRGKMSSVLQIIFEDSWFSSLCNRAQ